MRPDAPADSLARSLDGAAHGAAQGAAQGATGHRTLAVQTDNRSSMQNREEAILPLMPEALTAFSHGQSPKSADAASTNVASVKSVPLVSSLAVTVIVTILNDSESTSPVLQSAIRQTKSAEEIIIVDARPGRNRSDPVARFAQDHALTLLIAKSASPLEARNLGIERAGGDLIAILDQECVWYPNHLETLLEPFKYPRPYSLGWVYGNVDEVDSDGGLVVRSALRSLQYHKLNHAGPLRRDRLLSAPASMVDRRALLSVGGFDENLADYADEHLFFRLARAGYVSVFIDVPVLQRRWCEQQTGISRSAYARKLLHDYPDDSRPMVSHLAADQLSEVRQALAAVDHARIDRCVSELHSLEQYLEPGPSPGISQRDLLVTVVVPLYNGVRFIEEALRSVYNQSRKADEIIVVDDGSTDDGPLIVRRLAEEFPIRLIAQENAGQSSARNTGVDAAHGDVIAFLDQDDVWYPNHLEELLKPFAENRSIELGWSCSDLDEIDETGSMVIRSTLSFHKMGHPKLDLMTCLARDLFILPSASVVSRRAFKQVGGFDERLSGYEDDDLFLRLFRAGFDNVFLPQSLSKWRVYDSSSSYSTRMATSRMIYARSLIQRFPDDVGRSRYLIRDCIAPRFFRCIVDDLRRFTLMGDREMQRQQALEHLAFIVGYLRLSFRVPFRLFVMPALRIAPLARVLMRVSGPVWKIARVLL